MQFFIKTAIRIRRNGPGILLCLSGIIIGLELTCDWADSMKYEADLSALDHKEMDAM